MAAVLLPQGKQQYFTSAGVPLVGGKVFTYDAGTTNPRTTWADAGQIAPNTNPIILDARGEATIFWSGAYKVVIKDALDNVIWTVDGISSLLTSLAQSLIPALNNTYDLGSAAFAWRQLYLGPNGAPALDPSGNIGYWKRTANEIAAGVVPINFFFPPGNVRRYGAVGDGATDDTAAVQAACNGSKYVTFDPELGPYYFADVSVPTGVMVNGNGASMKLKPLVGTVGVNQHALFKANGKTDLAIINCVIDGNSAAQAADPGLEDSYAAIYLIGCDRWTVWGCRFSNTYGNGHVRVIDGSYIDHQGNYHDGTVSPGAGTDLQPGIYYTTTGTRLNTNVVIRGNRFNHSHPALTDQLAAQWLYNSAIVGNAVLQGNTLNSACCGVRASDVTISGNVFRGGFFGMTLSVGAGLRQQRRLTITGNMIASTQATFNGYGIEHAGYDLTITGNELVDCGITTSNPTSDGVVISGNFFRTTLATIFTEAAISVGGAGVQANWTVTGNVAYGHGSFLAFSNATGLNNCVVSHNVARLVLDPGASQFFAYRVASLQTINRIVIIGNAIENAQRGFANFETSAGTLTVNRAKIALNSLDSNSFGLSYLNATFTDSIYEPNSATPPTVTVAYAAAMTPDAILGTDFIITANNGVAFTVNAPTNGYSGQTITVTIRNASGGALGAATWNAIFKMSAWTQPANGFSRSITFRYNGANWVQVGQTGVDVPN